MVLALCRLTMYVSWSCIVCIVGGVHGRPQKFLYEGVGAGPKRPYPKNIKRPLPEKKKPLFKKKRSLPEKKRRNGEKGPEGRVPTLASPPPPAGTLGQLGCYGQWML